MQLTVKTSTCLVFILGSGWYQNQKNKTDHRTVHYIKLASCMTKPALTGPEFHRICHICHSVLFWGYLCTPPVCFPFLCLSFLWVFTSFDTKLRCDSFVSCFQEITGSVFYLILDVVDTECHVLSKKLWKDCSTRPDHSTVRILYFYLISHMISYSGTTGDCKIPTIAFLVDNKA